MNIRRLVLDVDMAIARPSLIELLEVFLPDPGWVGVAVALAALALLGVFLAEPFMATPTPGPLVSRWGAPS